MNLLNAFARKARPESRRRRASVQLGAESLEGRKLLSTATLGHHLVALPAVHVSTPTLAPSTAPLAPQQGSAFGLNWRAYYDSKTGNYNMNIQDVQGPGNVGMYRTKAGLWFTQNTYNPTTHAYSQTTVQGPTLPQDKFVSIRNFSKSGDVAVTMGTGLYFNFQSLPRTQVSYVSSPTGQIKLTYDYNSIANTATLTVDNIKGSGTFFYSAGRVNPQVGEFVDSPTSNPIQSIDFTLQSSDGYTGGAGVFHNGEADPTVNVVINHNGTTNSGYYTIKKGAW